MSHLSFFISILLLTGAPSVAQKIWSGAGDDESWSNPANWLGGAVPLPDDDVVLDNSFYGGSYRVVLPEYHVTIRSVQIKPSPEFTIELILPVENSEVPGFSVLGQGYAMNIFTGGIFRNASGAAAGSPLVVTDSIRINNGGRFVHNTRRGHSANIERLSRDAGTENGILEFDIPEPSTTISMSGRMFGILILKADAAGGSLNYTAAGTNRVVIRGGLEIGDGVNFNLNFSDTIAILGDLIIQNAMVNLGSTARSVVVSVAGDIATAAGARVTETGSGIQQILMVGNKMQQVSARGVIENDIVLVKAGGSVLHLSTPLTLPYALDIRNGSILSHSSALLTLGDLCVVVADTLNGSGYIDGPVQKTGLMDADFVFPVGKSDRLRWLQLMGASGDVTVEYFRSDPAVLSSELDQGLHHISGIEYWDITATESVTGTFKLSFDDLHSGGVTDLSDLRVAALRNNIWSNEGNTATAGSAGASGWVSGVPGSFDNGRTVVTLASASAGNPLPHLYIDFSMELLQERIVFHWSYTGDVDVRKFVLETSTDNKHFSPLYVEISGEDTENYRYELKSDFSGHQYFRINAFGNDGKSCVVSRVLKIKPSVFRGLTVIHTPSSPVLLLQVFMNSAEHVECIVTDVAGRIRSNAQSQLIAGRNRVAMPFSSMAPGIYFVTLQTKTGGRITTKFVKM